MTVRYYLRLRDLNSARGADPAFAFRAQSAEGIAEELQSALRTDALFERWRAAQDDPDAVDATLAATDPDAKVTGTQHDLHIDLVVDSGIPGSVLKQRLRLLAGNGWAMTDVTAG